MSDCNTNLLSGSDHKLYQPEMKVAAVLLALADQLSVVRLVVAGLALAHGHPAGHSGGGQHHGDQRDQYHGDNDKVCPVAV